nr:MAG TPA: hypothetical protein [Caudoviricetes sp.]
MKKNKKKNKQNVVVPAPQPRNDYPWNAEKHFMNNKVVFVEAEGEDQNPAPNAGDRLPAGMSIDSIMSISGQFVVGKAIYKFENNSADKSLYDESFIIEDRDGKTIFEQGCRTGDLVPIDQTDDRDAFISCISRFTGWHFNNVKSTLDERRQIIIDCALS